MIVTILHGINNASEIALRERLIKLFEDVDCEINCFDDNFSEEDESSDAWLTLTEILNSDIVAFDLSSKEPIIAMAVGAVAALNKVNNKEIQIMAMCDDTRVERNNDVGAIFIPIGFDQTMINLILDNGDIYATEEAFINGLYE